KGWLHEQDNDKVIRSENGDELVAQEKGMNTYRKVAEADCEVAKTWWKENSAYWADVRHIWDELFESRERISIRKKVDDQLLFMKLFALQDEMLGGDAYNSTLSKTKIRATI